MMHVVFPRPEQLHRHAGLTGLGPFLSDQSGDLRDLDVIFVVQPAAETASCANQMERDILVLDPGRYCSIESLRSLTWRPDFQLAVFVMRSRIHRLEWGVRQQWEGILGFDDLGRPLEGRFDIAVLGA